MVWDVCTCEVTDDIIAYEKKLRWFQLLKDFNCTVTSTWTNNEEGRELVPHVAGLVITGSQEAA